MSFDILIVSLKPYPGFDFPLTNGNVIQAVKQKRVNLRKFVKKLSKKVYQKKEERWTIT